MDFQKVKEVMLGKIRLGLGQTVNLAAKEPPVTQEGRVAPSWEHPDHRRSLLLKLPLVLGLTENPICLLSEGSHRCWELRTHRHGLVCSCGCGPDKSPPPKGPPHAAELKQRRGPENHAAELTQEVTGTYVPKKFRHLTHRHYTKDHSYLQV